MLLNFYRRRENLHLCVFLSFNHASRNQQHQVTYRSTDLLYIHSKECPLRDTSPLTLQEDIREESEGTEDEEISRPAEGTKEN